MEDKGVALEKEVAMHLTVASEEETLSVKEEGDAVAKEGVGGGGDNVDDVQV